MGKIKNAFSLMADVAVAYGEREDKIRELTKILMTKTRDADYESVYKVATVLVDQAEINWK